jgi:hypothetical protein
MAIPPIVPTPVCALAALALAVGAGELTGVIA